MSGTEFVLMYGIWGIVQVILWYLWYRELIAWRTDRPERPWLKRFWLIVYALWALFPAAYTLVMN